MFYYLYNKVVCTPNTHVNTYEGFSRNHKSTTQVCIEKNTCAFDQREEAFMSWAPHYKICWEKKKNHYLNTDTQRASRCDTTLGLLHCTCAVVIWGVSHLKLRCKMHILRLYHKHGNFRIKRHIGVLRRRPGGCGVPRRWKGTSYFRIPPLSTICQLKAGFEDCLERHVTTTTTH